MCEIERKLKEKIITVTSENVELRKENLKLQEAIDKLGKNQNKQVHINGIKIISFAGKSAEFTEFLKNLNAEQEALHGRA